MKKRENSQLSCNRKSVGGAQCSYGSSQNRGTHRARRLAAVAVAARGALARRQRRLAAAAAGRRRRRAARSTARSVAAGAVVVRGVVQARGHRGAGLRQVVGVALHVCQRASGGGGTAQAVGCHKSTVSLSMTRMARVGAFSRTIAAVLVARSASKGMRERRAQKVFYSGILASRTTYFTGCWGSCLWRAAATVRGLGGGGRRTEGGPLPGGCSPLSSCVHRASRGGGRRRRRQRARGSSSL